MTVCRDGLPRWFAARFVLYDPFAGSGFFSTSSQMNELEETISEMEQYHRENFMRVGSLFTSTK